jgi:hypothetical protein
MQEYSERIHNARITDASGVFLTPGGRHGPPNRAGPLCNPKTFALQSIAMQTNAPIPKRDSLPANLKPV